MLPTSEKYLGGVRRLVRQGVLSRMDWLEMIEARRELIEPHLNTMDLKTIGKARVADYSNSWCIVEANNPWVLSFDPGLNLDTRCWWPMGEGLYSNHMLSRIQHIYDPPGSSPAVGCTDTFWALTRSGRWVIVTATVRFPDHRQSWAGMLRSKVLRVEIREVLASDIIATLKIEPQDLWGQLGKLARQWQQRREELLTDARRLVEVFDFEDSLYRHVKK